MRSSLAVKSCLQSSSVRSPGLLESYSVHVQRIIIRSVMPIESERARGPLRFLSQVGFECNFQKTKKLPNNIFYI